MGKGKDKLGADIKGVWDNLTTEESNNSVILEKNNSSMEEMQNSRKEDLQNSTEEDKIKSGYRLKVSTLQKLNEMKVYMYPPKTSFESIVDEAICKLYESRKQGN